MKVVLRILVLLASLAIMIWGFWPPGESERAASAPRPDPAVPEASLENPGGEVVGRLFQRESEPEPVEEPTPPPSPAPADRNGVGDLLGGSQLRAREKAEEVLDGVSDRREKQMKEIGQ